MLFSFKQYLDEYTLSKFRRHHTLKSVNLNKGYFLTEKRGRLKRVNNNVLSEA